MDCKHSFKNTTRFFCVHFPFEKNVLYFLKHKSDSSEEENCITQIIMNMPNYFFLNVFILF